MRDGHSRPHPFHDEGQLADGTWKLGEPGWFDIVDDDQLQSPRNDKGLKLHREQALVWLYAPEHLTEKGVTPEQPVKAFEDCNDSTRMITANWGSAETAKTEKEVREEKLSPNVQRANIPNLAPADQARAEMTRIVQLGELDEDEKAEASSARRASRHLVPRGFHAPRIKLPR